MRTKRTKGYIDETAKEFKIRSSQVQQVADSMFRFAAEIMSEGDRKLMDFADVRIMGWGVFRVKEGRRKHFQRINDGEKTRNKGDDGGS